MVTILYNGELTINTTNKQLIESIDNANNINSMKMWTPIVSLLTHPQSSPPIQHATLWILGTAVQNNDKAQMAVLNYEPLEPILELLNSSSDGEVRSKAMYALSGILKHNPKAVDLFGKANGWAILKGALMDSNVSLRRKAAFLVNTLLLQDDSADTASSSNTDTIATTANSSRTTAIAPLNTPASVSSAAPLEQLPATLTSGVAHPSIPPLLVSSNLLDVLIFSILPSSLQANIPATILNKVESVSTVGGPDGDVELREDLDFAEKASQTCLTFVEKVKEQGGSPALFDNNKQGFEETKVLLGVLGQELQGKPIEKEDGIEYRWQELGLGRDEVAIFIESVKSL
jgi:hsp70-interacting protein